MPRRVAGIGKKLMMEEQAINRGEILALTTEIVSAHLANNAVGGNDVPELIQTVFNKLNELASGEEAVFQGDIALTATHEQAEQIGEWLCKAAEFISAVGALKGIGFGQVCAAATTVRALANPVEPVAVAAQETLWLSFGLDRPFCFAKPGRGRGNLFESLNFVPGAAIKGALLAAASRLAGSPKCWVRARCQSTNGS